MVGPPSTRSRKVRDESFVIRVAILKKHPGSWYTWDDAWGDVYIYIYMHIIFFVQFEPTIWTSLLQNKIFPN